MNMLILYGEYFTYVYIYVCVFMYECLLEKVATNCSSITAVQASIMFKH